MTELPLLPLPPEPDRSLPGPVPFAGPSVAPAAGGIATLAKAPLPGSAPGSTQVSAGDIRSFDAALAAVDDGDTGSLELRPAVATGSPGSMAEMTAMLGVYLQANPAAVAQAQPSIAPAAVASGLRASRPVAPLSDDDDDAVVGVLDAVPFPEPNPMFDAIAPAASSATLPATGARAQPESTDIVRASRPAEAISALGDAETPPSARTAAVAGYPIPQPVALRDEGDAKAWVMPSPQPPSANGVAQPAAFPAAMQAVPPQPAFLPNVGEAVASGATLAPGTQAPVSAAAPSVLAPVAEHPIPQPAALRGEQDAKVPPATQAPVSAATPGARTPAVARDPIPQPVALRGEQDANVPQVMPSPKSPPPNGVAQPPLANGATQPLASPAAVQAVPPQAAALPSEGEAVASAATLAPATQAPLSSPTPSVRMAAVASDPKPQSFAPGDEEDADPRVAMPLPTAPSATDAMPPAASAAIVRAPAEPSQASTVSAASDGPAASRLDVANIVRQVTRTLALRDLESLDAGREVVLRLDGDVLPQTVLTLRAVPADATDVAGGARVLVSLATQSDEVRQFLDSRGQSLIDAMSVEAPGLRWVPGTDGAWVDRAAGAQSSSQDDPGSSAGQDRGASSGASSGQGQGQGRGDADSQQAAATTVEAARASADASMRWSTLSETARRQAATAFTDAVGGEA